MVAPDDLIRTRSTGARDDAAAAAHVESDGDRRALPGRGEPLSREVSGLVDAEEKGLRSNGESSEALLGRRTGALGYLAREQRKDRERPSNVLQQGQASRQLVHVGHRIGSRVTAWKRKSRQRATDSVDSLAARLAWRLAST